jgi:predicted amidophosphoribosyltransferase
MRLDDAVGQPATISGCGGNLDRDRPLCYVCYAALRPLRCCAACSTSSVSIFLLLLPLLLPALPAPLLHVLCSIRPSTTPLR